MAQCPLPGVGAGAPSIQLHISIGYGMTYEIQHIHDLRIVTLQRHEQICLTVEDIA